MECTILKAFPLSRDGIKSEMLTVGAVVDVPDSLVDGLKNAGYVANGGDPQPVVSEPIGTVQAVAEEPANTASEEPVVSEPKAAGGKARQSKDHQVQ